MQGKARGVDGWREGGEGGGGGGGQAVDQGAADKIS